MTGDIGIWIGFNIFILILLALDLGVFHRGAHVVRVREALIWSGIWILVALAFNVVIYFWRGSEMALAFLTGYLIERSLSIDNIFVFLLVFSYFKVPSRYQYRVLFWGILGALVSRAVLIAAGVSLIERFSWVIYVFGAFLIFTGIKLITQRDQKINPENNPLLKLFRRIMPVSKDFVGSKFFFREGGKLIATPLFIVLLVIESTDIVFALDSIPAILAITTDPFIVYTSNIFAILGLRALYFAVAGLMGLFRFLDYGLSAILVFVGAKMLLSEVYHLPVELALLVIGAILTTSILASIVWPDRSGKAANTHDTASEDDTAAGSGGFPSSNGHSPSKKRNVRPESDREAVRR